MIKTHVRSMHSFYQNNPDGLILEALHVLETRLCCGKALLTRSDDVKAYLRLHLSDRKSEVFAVLFLNNQNRLLAFEKLFYGTINEAKIYPRIIVQKVVKHNAAKVILAHNHLASICTPSIADQEVTEEIQKILKIIDVDVLDHIIVSNQDCYSFAEHGLLSF